jgi:hypothetical protein
LAFFSSMANAGRWAWRQEEAQQRLEEQRQATMVVDQAQQEADQQRIVEAKAVHRRTRKTQRNEAEAKNDVEVNEEREARSGEAVTHLCAISRDEQLQSQVALVVAPTGNWISSLQAARLQAFELMPDQPFLAEENVLMPGRAYQPEEEVVTFESIDETPADYGDDVSVLSIHSSQSIDMDEL